MANEPKDDRKSKAEAPDLITDPHEKARREADNGLRQYDQVLEIVEHYRDTKRPFKLRPSVVI
ncbi:MAG TPA: hypothetical protein VMU87_00930, partial [Stellaceae bacterium]|nr:hypothetical protein [Stellaceae bacterium]